MIYTPKITSDIQINSLKDLVKLKPFLEDSTLKINKSQIARELGKDRRTVDKYLKGYEKPTARKRSSCIDDYYDIIKELLSDENQQIFYYKRVLWQFLKDNHGLSCAQSSFRRYISQHSEFQSYFERRQKRHIKKKSHLRFETPLGKQAQLDWKESMKFLLSLGNGSTSTSLYCCFHHHGFVFTDYLYRKHRISYFPLLMMHLKHSVEFLRNF